MTTTDTRPPLYLTASQATNWFSLHSDDIGREIVITENPVRLPSPEYVDAWRGFGRWERGLCGGEWPEKTVFARDFLERPPAFVTVRNGVVRFSRMPEGMVYSLRGKAHPLVKGMLGDDRFAARLRVMKP